MRRLIVFGGSGVIGRAVLEAASADPSVGDVRALQRRPVRPPLARVHDQQVADFGDLRAQHRVLAATDAVVFALGVSLNDVSEREYRRITLDYPLEAAHRLAEANPRAAFVFVSSRGADPSGRSRFRYSSTKGEAERCLRDVPLGRLVIARPAFVVPRTWPRPQSLADRMLMPFARLLAPALPEWAITSEAMGQALLRAALNPHVEDVLESKDLRALGERRPSTLIPNQGFKSKPT